MIKTIHSDFHLHSHHSHDAFHTINEMCRGAIKNGLDTVCFTEHTDFGPNDGGYGHFDFTKYSADIEKARDKWSGQLRILKGIEFGEPDRYPEKLEEAHTQDYDFILASVHVVLGHDTYFEQPEQYRNHDNAKRFFVDLYTQILHTVTTGGFDAIAHMDFPVRFIPRSYIPEDIIGAICEALIKNSIALELNASPLRRGKPDINPSVRIREIYAEKGGTRVTLGSDAHTPEDIGQNFDKVIKMVNQHGFTPVGFIERQEFTITH